MLSKFLLVGISALLILPILSSVSNAVILVPSHGETGWQTYSYTFEEPWSGWVGIGVSDDFDETLASYLLIDNLVNMGPSGNQSFEMGDLTGYTVLDRDTPLSTAPSFVPSTTSCGGTTYTPTGGTLMARGNQSHLANTRFLSLHSLKALYY